MRWLRRIGYGIGALVALVLIAVGAAYAASESRIRKVHPVANEPTLAVASTPDAATLARGQHLVTAIGKCVECHGDHFQGNAFISDPVMGQIVAPNLTSGRGGIGATLTPTVIERAVRHGVGPDGRSLRIMPAADYQWMSDSDVAAVAAYIRSLPPVDHDPGATNVKLLPRVLLVAGKFPMLSAETVEQEPGTPMAPSASDTLAYGKYLAHIGGCTGCHGPNLSGGKIADGSPDWPPAMNLTPAGELGQWTEAQFVSTLRTGMRPAGVKLNDVMPWKLTGQMSDAELHALWVYLKSVPARPFGQH